jgi:hypothetical protein
MAQRTVIITTTVSDQERTAPRNVTVARTPDFDYLVGDVDGVPFRYKSANRQTAERERDRAARALAAWTAVLDGVVR